MERRCFELCNLRVSVSVVFIVRKPQRRRDTEANNQAPKIGGRMPEASTQMTLEALRSVPLFASLDDDAARDLRNLLSEETVPQNTRLFRQGDTGDAMHLIESGRVQISIRDEE